MADHRSKLAAIVREHEAQILAEWIDLLAKGGAGAASTEREVEGHARAFVAAARGSDGG